MKRDSFYFKGNGVVELLNRGRFDPYSGGVSEWGGGLRGTS